MISGCGSKIPKLENGSDAVVTFKDGSMISVDELYNSMKTNYALSALLDLTDKKLIEEKYADRTSEANASVDEWMSQLETQYGDDLESQIQSAGYADIAAYRSAYYLYQIRSIAVQEYGKAQIKDEDIEKYYNDEIVGDIKVNHILITPDVTDDMTTEEKTAAEDAAKEEIEEIINTLKATKKEELEAKFTELAKEKSEDTSTKESGGSLGYINKGTLGDAYAELEEAAYKLKDGEFSTEVITTEIGYHVIIRLDSKEKASLDEVRDTIIEDLADELIYSDYNTYYVKALKELRDEYDIDIQDSEIKKSYANYIQSYLTKQDDSQSSSSTQKTN